MTMMVKKREQLLGKNEKRFHDNSPPGTGFPVPVQYLLPELLMQSRNWTHFKNGDCVQCGGITSRLRILHVHSMYQKPFCECTSTTWSSRMLWTRVQLSTEEWSGNSEIWLQSMYVQLAWIKILHLGIIE